MRIPSLSTLSSSPACFLEVKTIGHHSQGPRRRTASGPKAVVKAAGSHWGHQAGSCRGAAPPAESKQCPVPTPPLGPLGLLGSQEDPHAQTWG